MQVHCVCTMCTALHAHYMHMHMHMHVHLHMHIHMPCHVHCMCNAERALHVCRRTSRLTPTSRSTTGRSGRTLPLPIPSDLNPLTLPASDPQSTKPHFNPLRRSSPHRPPPAASNPVTRTMALCRTGRALQARH